MAFKVGSQTVIDISVATGETQIESSTGKNIALYPDQHTWIKQGTTLVFEGTTANDFETTLTVTDPTADRTLTLPDSTGTLALEGNVLALSGGTMTGDIDGAGNKVLFANKYDNLADLPNATTYHGMFAHVHATGLAYYAHAGAWIPLAKTTGATFSDSVVVDAAGATPLTVDRATSDGTIIDVQKDGSSVGTIGTNGSR